MLIKALYEASRGCIASLMVGKMELIVDEDVKETCLIFTKIHTALMVFCMMASFYLADRFGTYSFNNCLALSVILMVVITAFYSLLVSFALKKRYKKEGR